MSSTLFRSLLPEGWFVSVAGTDEDRITVICQMFSRDYDDETGYTDIVLGELDSEPPDTAGLPCVAKYYGVFELQSSGPAVLLEQTMPEDMANAIAALIVPANFPEAAEYLPQEEYPEDEDSRIAFWGAITEQVYSMEAAGDHWGALRVQTEAVNKLINWQPPPPEEEGIPEPNLEDMVPPTYSLIEAADAEQEDYLPVGAHLLPEDFQEFLWNWNKTIADSAGDWRGEPRQAYKLENPEKWRQFRVGLKQFTRCYPADLEALKAYQASPEGMEEMS